MAEPAQRPFFHALFKYYSDTQFVDYTSVSTTFECEIVTQDSVQLTLHITIDIMSKLTSKCYCCVHNKIYIQYIRSMFAFHSFPNSLLFASRFFPNTLLMLFVQSNLLAEDAFNDNPRFHSSILLLHRLSVLRLIYSVKIK